MLERQSLVLSAERRMGKTTIIRKMEAEVSQKGVLAFYRDLENVRTPIEFVEVIREDVQSALSLRQRTAQGFLKLLSTLGGGEAAGVKLPEIAAPSWERLLEVLITDLMREPAQTVVFFWDELPLMIYNIRNSSGEQTAMEVLDTLRALRQMHGSHLRMVFTGSIGLHNVLTSLKRAGYANDPTNDMLQEDVPPLDPGSAQELASQLIEGEQLNTPDPQHLARAIATAGNGMPFYIQHVVDRLTAIGSAIGAGQVEEVVQQFLCDPQDVLHLRYYRERIATYYTSAEQPLALAVLDVLAATSPAIGFSEIHSGIQANPKTADSEDEAVREILTLLQKDHYITRDSQGNYAFRSSFIQRYWRFARGVL